MFTAPEVAILLLIAALGHLVALLWYLADKHRWKMCERTIYDLPIGAEQTKREMRNSLHAPMHAVIPAAFLYLGFFRNTSVSSFFYSGDCDHDLGGDLALQLASGLAARTLPVHSWSSRRLSTSAREISGKLELSTGFKDQIRTRQIYFDR